VSFFALIPLGKGVGSFSYSNEMKVTQYILRTKSQEQVHHVWRTLWDKYKAVRCRAEHMGGQDGDDTDLNDETQGVLKSQSSRFWGQISKEVLDEFEESAVYHLIDEA